MKHTKGEWIIDKDNTMVAILKDGVYKYIADCEPNHFCDSDLEQDECEANAQLIATAPELLEACELLLFSFRGQKYAKGSAIDYCKKIINKAKGV